MGALKHSLHSCYFCYHLKTVPLNEEVAFFNSRLGRSRTLLELLNQRRTVPPVIRLRAALCAGPLPVAPTDRVG